MGNDKIQKKLLQYISDYNDGKIKFRDLDGDGKEKYNKEFKDGIGHKVFVGIWLELKFVEELGYEKEKIEENLRLLSEDKKIKIIPNKEGKFKYLETESPVFLTSAGYKELSFFKKHPLEYSLGLTLVIISIINGIIPWIKMIVHYLDRILK